MADTGPRTERLSFPSISKRWNGMPGKGESKDGQADFYLKHI